MNAHDSWERYPRVLPSPGDSPTKHRHPHETESRSKVIVRLVRATSMITDDYRGLPKGSVRPGYRSLDAGSGSKRYGVPTGDAIAA